MEWPNFTRASLPDAAVCGLIVLAVGSLAARLCRQPVRRARLVVLTLVGGVIAPLVAALPFVPTWSAGVLPATSDVHLVGRAARDPVGLKPLVITSRWQPARMPAGVGPLPMITEKGVSATSANLARNTRWTPPSAGMVLFGAYAAGTAAMAVWWCLGQIVLWRVTRAARPVRGAARDVFLAISGPAGARVTLLESDRIALAFTYTWIRPVIVVPRGLCDEGEVEAIRYVLAHEWSHVERRDSWAWHLACLSGFVLFYQPLFWWLRRQLRLSQDYLADARAAAEGSAEDYAAFLVRLARIQKAGTFVPALGIRDTRSNLSRRVVMLVQDRTTLERRCRPVWSLTASAIAATTVIAAAGLRLDAAKAEGEHANPTAVKKSEPSQLEGEILHYSGVVKETGTGKLIAGATVIVRRYAYRPSTTRLLQETRHTTAADGSYTFMIRPDQSAEKSLVIGLAVEHPGYAAWAGFDSSFGASLTMIRASEALGKQAFFRSIELRPALPVTGRLETPEGAPAGGVKIVAHSAPEKRVNGRMEHSSVTRTTTNADGTFRVPITSPGRGVISIVPDDYAPEIYELSTQKRGDLGALRLKNGTKLTGRVVDAEGKPLAGLVVTAALPRKNSPERELINELFANETIDRTTETDVEGRFTFAPLSPGDYTVVPTASVNRDGKLAGQAARVLPAVFANDTFTIAKGGPVAPLEIRAVRHVLIEGEFSDGPRNLSKTSGCIVTGRLDGSTWRGTTQPDAQGKFSLRVPLGLEHTSFTASTVGQVSVRLRVGKDGPPLEGRTAYLGTLDHDVPGIQIIRYAAPMIVIDATSKDGQRINGFKATVRYDGYDLLDPKGNVRLSSGPTTIGANTAEPNDGRYRTVQLLPDREVNVVVQAERFSPAVRKLKLPEAKIEELTVVLEPK